MAVLDPMSVERRRFTAIHRETKISAGAKTNGFPSPPDRGSVRCVDGSPPWLLYEDLARYTGAQWIEQPKSSKIRLMR